MTNTPAGPPPPAGWYPHPWMADTNRYWDGTAWTDHIAPVAVAPPPPRDTSFDLGWSQRHPAPPEPDHGGLIVGGYVMAILLPLIGFIIGIVLLAKGKTGHGLGAMILSVIAFFVWADVLTPDATTYDYGY
ncbi:MAG: DUF2510 domain-containing protein [Nocardioides sp.]